MTAHALPPHAQLIARGLSAEVYAWDADTVLKLFLPHVSPFSADYEANCSAALAQCALPLAPFHRRLDIQGRLGLLFQRIPGPSGLDVIGRAPWQLLPVMLAMARAQARINACTAPAAMLDLHDRLQYQITHQTALTAAERDRVLAYLERLPREDALCHGDLHPGQLILTPEGAVVIDWANAARGCPAADVARSWLLLRMGPPIRHPMLAVLVQGGLALAAQAFLAMRLWLARGTITRAQIDTWLLPLMAARLEEHVPGEEARLLRRIRQRLARLPSASAA
ncbi:MAG: aminoglycoside phosphotransferase family protein [Uliginosibacterium sp.]|nr:aminoglycoside phosphotransferase family protein [Uliginosibacterium sp.]